MSRPGAVPKKAATSSMECLSGVAIRSGSGEAQGASSTGEGTETAFSRLAAAPQAGQWATRSSPASERTMNSWERLPPMAPECASTAKYSRPDSAKIRQ